MILWLVLYVASVFSQSESQVVESYCFISQSQKNQVKAQLKLILIPADTTQESQKCLSVMTTEYRRVLIQQYIKRIAPNVVLEFSSVDRKQETCSLKITKIKSGIQESLQVSQSLDNKDVNLNIDTKQNEKASTDITMIQTVKEFEISVNQNVVKGECRAINSSRYEITLEIRQDPLPSTPPLPPGSFVVIPPSQTPKDQETSQLKTVVQLNRGEKREISSLFKNLSAPLSKVDLQAASLDMKKDDSALNEIVFLSIE